MALGSVATGKFQTVFNSLIGLRMEEEPLPGAEKRITRQIYYLQFKPQMNESTELIEVFVEHVGRILDLWITDSLVQTRWEIQDELNSTFLGEKQ